MHQSHFVEHVSWGGPGTAEGAQSPTPIIDDLFTLAFIDLETRPLPSGHFYDKEIWRRIESEVIPDKPSERGDIFILYVHGTTHNGHTCDNHMRNFRRVLEYVALRERRTSREKNLAPRPVLGLAVGWHGQNLLTATARAEDSAPHLASLLEPGGKLHSYMTMLASDTRVRGSTAVIAGQSNGARLVFDAIEQMKTPDAQTQPFADVLLFMNPFLEWPKALQKDGEIKPDVESMLKRSAGTVVFYQTARDRVVTFTNALKLRRSVGKYRKKKEKKENAQGELGVENKFCTERSDRDPRQRPWDATGKALSPIGLDADISECIGFSLDQHYSQWRSDPGTYEHKMAICAERMRTLQSEHFVSFYFYNKGKRAADSPRLVSRSAYDLVKCPVPENDEVLFVYDDVGDIKKRDRQRRMDKQLDRIDGDQPLERRAAVYKHVDIFNSNTIDWVFELVGDRKARMSQDP